MAKWGGETKRRRVVGITASMSPQYLELASEIQKRIQRDNLSKDEALVLRDHLLVQKK